MNQIVDAETLVSAVPLDRPAVKKMTRSEKLLHWASLIRPVGYVSIYHRLEYFTGAMLNQPISWTTDGSSLFAIALRDPVLQEQGLTGSPYGSEGIRAISPQQIMDFFELSQAELHAFSCDCGGAMTGREIASRMEGMARYNPQKKVSSLLGRVRAALG